MSKAAAITAIDIASRMMSPYDIPFASNPLSKILADSVDFKRIATAPIKLFVTATNVRGRRGHRLRWGHLRTDRPWPEGQPARTA